jgi:hypothetical protein
VHPAKVRVPGRVASPHRPRPDMATNTVMNGLQMVLWHRIHSFSASPRLGIGDVCGAMSRHRPGVDRHMPLPIDYYIIIIVVIIICSSSSSCPQSGVEAEPSDLSNTVMSTIKLRYGCSVVPSYAFYFNALFSLMMLQMRRPHSAKGVREGNAGRGICQ